MNVRSILALLSSSLLLACTGAEPGGFAPGEDGGDGWSLNNPSPGADAGQDTSLLPDVSAPAPDSGGPPPLVDSGGPPPPVDAGGPDPVDSGGPPPPLDMGAPGGGCATNSDCSMGTVCCAGTSGTLSCTPEADCFFDGTCTQDSECPNGGSCCDFSQFGLPQNVCRPTCGMGGGGMTGCMNNSECAADEVCCPGLGGAPKCEPKDQCAVGGLCGQDTDCRDSQSCCSLGVPNLSICNDRCSF